MSDVQKGVLCLVLALVVVFSFSACRHSPVLEQTIYSENGEVDPNNQQTDNDEEHTEEDTSIAPKTTRPTASRQASQSRTSAKPKPTSVRQQPQSNTGSQTQATTGAKPESQSNSNKAQGETPNVNPDPNANNRAVDDRANFNPEELPKDLATVAAVGEAAAFVEMLGGSNRLIATSASFKQNSLASLIDTNYQNIEVFASGNGSNIVDDNQFDLLLRKNPEAVFYVSEVGYGSFTFDDSQLTELLNHKIYAIPLHPFNTTKNIIENVTVMGQVLGKRSDIQGSKDANEMAKKYIDWLNDLPKKIDHAPFSGPNKWNLDLDGKFNSAESDNSYEDSGSYTILIDGWESDTTTSRDNGIAYAKTGYYMRHSPVSHYLSLGGAANMAVLISDDSDTIPYFPVVPTYNDLSGVSIKGSGIGQNVARRKANHVTGGFYSAYIGDTNFRKIIVDSVTTYNNIIQSNAWAPTIVESDGNTSGYGYINSNGRLVSSNIHGSDFMFVVNPSGVGSWTEGSPESPLEALWADQLFYYDLSETEAFENIRSSIEEFYYTFYGHTLTPQELADIQDGI